MPFRTEEREEMYMNLKNVDTAHWGTSEQGLYQCCPFKKKLRDLYAQSYRSRMAVLEMTYQAGMGHIGSDFSCLDILTALYFGVLKLNPEDANWPERDRFILSKGHAAGALYVTLAARGLFPEDWLTTYQQFDSKLQGHPDRRRLPGIEHNTGALGHGLSVAAGIAAGLQFRTRAGSKMPRVFALIGDGELQEGSNWEAAMLAAQLGLTNLVAIIDRNRLQQGDRTENTVGLGDLAAKWESFGWQVCECNGHDIEELLTVFGIKSQRPMVVIARTVKGCGVSFMEDNPIWHHRVPSADEKAKARAEIARVLAAIEGDEAEWLTFVKHSPRL